MKPAIVFDHVWKKFRQGERHDSLRDLIPGFARRLGKTRDRNALEQEEFWALQDVSFTVEPGKALGIIGSNGAGKSTTLKLLTRILKPTRGGYETHGRVGALIEVAAGFHPDLTGRENVLLQGAIMGMTRAEIARRFDAIVDFAGVAKFIDTPVKRYSSGMNARLGFSIAAHLNPQVLLIDEVLAVGDTEFQNRCFERIREFKRQGTAIAFVSHNLKVVADLCDEVLLLHSGEAKAIGNPAEVIAQYFSIGSDFDKNDGAASIVVRARAADTQKSLDTLLAGDRVLLNIRVEFRRDVPQAIVGVLIWDSQRGMPIYEATSDLAGVSPMQAVAGDEWTLDLEFSAHLVHGIYQIQVYVHDLTVMQHLSMPRPVATLRVLERGSQRGVANLYLSQSAPSRPEAPREQDHSAPALHSKP